MSSRFVSRTCSILALGAFAGLLASCSSDTKTGPKPPGGGGAGGAAGAAAGASGKAGAGGAGGATDGGTTDGGLAALQARGNYLVNAVIACSDCHTPQLPTGGPDMTKFLAGNPTFVKLPNGDALGTRNLTNDETGLKNRTDDEIKNMFLNGIRPTATGMEALNPVMPYYVFHNMKAADADAIVAYLRTVPAVSNTIPRRALAFDVPAAAPPLTLTKSRRRRPGPPTWPARCAGSTWRRRSAFASSATPSTSTRAWRRCWTRRTCSKAARTSARCSRRR